MGLRYCRGTGAIRLMYCTIIALVLSLIRIICDLAMGFAILHRASWTFMMASLIDFLLAVASSTAAWFAIRERTHGLVIFAVVSFLETALYSVTYFLIIIIESRRWKINNLFYCNPEETQLGEPQLIVLCYQEVTRAWNMCTPPTSRCNEFSSELSAHGVLAEKAAHSQTQDPKHWKSGIFFLNPISFAPRYLPGEILDHQSSLRLAFADSGIPSIGAHSSPSDRLWETKLCLILVGRVVGHICNSNLGLQGEEFPLWQRNFYFMCMHWHHVA